MTTLPPPTAADTLRACAEAEHDARAATGAAWSRGFTRRRFLQGTGMVGVAAFASQLVTSRVAFAGADDAASTNSVVLVTLRGGVDGLRLCVPVARELGGEYLAAVRPSIMPTPDLLRPLAGSRGWAVNAAFDPLLPLWATGEFGVVPAAGFVSPSRSHVDAQAVLDGGGAVSATGWIDRMLTTLGPGTTLRTVGIGGKPSNAVVGPEAKLVVPSLQAFTLPAARGMEAQVATAVETLYRGLDGPLPQAVGDALSGLTAVAAIDKVSPPHNGAVYPAGDFGAALADVARLLHAEAGVQVATVDVGGWDTHTREVDDLDPAAHDLATALAAFLADLGPERRKRVTVVVVSEFGRRVMENQSAGCDHGRAGPVWLLGGGLTKSQVIGPWQPLGPATLDQGDVRVQTSVFDVLGEVVRTRLGASSLASVFPGSSQTSLGFVRAA